MSRFSRMGVCAVMKKTSLLVTWTVPWTYKSRTIMLPIKFRWDLTAEGAHGCLWPSSKFKVISTRQLQDQTWHLLRSHEHVNGNIILDSSNIGPSHTVMPKTTSGKLSTLEYLIFFEDTKVKKRKQWKTLSNWSNELRIFTLRATPCTRRPLREP